MDWYWQTNININCGEIGCENAADFESEFGDLKCWEHVAQQTNAQLIFDRINSTNQTKGEKLWKQKNSRVGKF